MPFSANFHAFEAIPKKNPSNAIIALSLTNIEHIQAKFQDDISSNFFFLASKMGKEKDKIRRRLNDHSETSLHHRTMKTEIASFRGPPRC